MNALERIPEEQISPRQRALLRERLALYRLIREQVTHLEEIEWHAYGTFAICLDNHTIIRVSRKLSLYAAKYPYFLLYFPCLECVVLGENEADILEIVTFLWSLRGSKDIHLVLFKQEIDGEDCTFDFSSLRPEQLARILNANPEISFGKGVWNEQQSIVLTSRPHPLQLHLTVGAFDDVGFAFDDGGTAFVRELENRQSSFGSLDLSSFESKIPFSRSNFERLLKLELFENLEINVLDKELVKLPFTAKSNALVYQVSSKTMKSSDFDALDISPKSLNLTISLYDEDWEKHLMAFLERAVQLGHLEQLTLRIINRHRRPFQLSKVADVAKALCRAIHANPNLKYLNLGVPKYEHPRNCIDWSSKIPKLFQMMAVHQGLRTVVLEHYSPTTEDYSHLEQLLSCNRYITVLDRFGTNISNRAGIDKLYALNGFFTGSAGLVKQSTLVRASLVGTTLVESASNNVQYTALLLSDHADVLCAFIQNLLQDDLDASQSMLEAAESKLPVTKKLRRE
jgi:hypothetical protein